MSAGEKWFVNCCMCILIVTFLVLSFAAPNVKVRIGSMGMPRLADHVNRENYYYVYLNFVY